MNDFALLIDGAFQRIERRDERPENIPHKLVTWHDVVRETGDAFEGLENDVWVIRTPEPSVSPPQVPYSVSPRQVRLLLLQQDMLDQVEAMVAQRDRATQITWQYALEFHRDDPKLVELAADFGLSDQQIDEFFIAAAAL